MPEKFEKVHIVFHAIIIQCPIKLIPPCTTVYQQRDKLFFKISITGVPFAKSVFIAKVRNGKKQITAKLETTATAN